MKSRTNSPWCVSAVWLSPEMLLNSLLELDRIERFCSKSCQKNDPVCGNVSWGRNDNSWGSGQSRTGNGGVGTSFNFLVVSPSGPPGWPTVRCSYLDQGREGSTAQERVDTGRRQCLKIQNQMLGVREITHFYLVMVNSMVSKK